MSKKTKIFNPSFQSLDDEIAYLKRKNIFLTQHAELLADKQLDHSKNQIALQLKELVDIKSSLSWKITRPLRKINRIIKNM